MRDPQPFRSLYEHLVDQPAGVGRRRLAAAVGGTAALTGMFDPLRSRGQRWYEVKPQAAQQSLIELLHHLHALSRVSDLLIEWGCPAGDPGDGAATGGRTLDRACLDAHREFFAGAGFDAVWHRDLFSPFHHEIFAVVPDESLREVVLDEVLWPGFRLGQLLFCRAGVRVRAPSSLIDPVAATTSPLFFTFRRYPRRTCDQSHGWGSNSQWRTTFARFYEDADGRHFNWDGEADISTDPPELRPDSDDPEEDRPVAERRELLLYRCLVSRQPAPGFDPYPFDDRLTLPSR